MGILSDVEEELIPELPRFFENYRNDLDQLKQSLDERDQESIESTSHRIKGSSGSWGFQDIHEAALKLEEASKSGDWKGMEDHLNTLKERINEAQVAVEAELNEEDD